MTRLRFLAASALLAAVAGCGDAPFSPVSGVVTLDGKPYGKAVVSFQPIATDDNSNPGRGSSAYTDENGRFVLKSDENNGAVVGKHLVRIMTREDQVGSGESPEGGSPDDAPVNRPGEPIPPEWHARSDKQFDVPPGGTDKANFDIVTKKR